MVSAVGLAGCPDVPPPLAHQPVESDGAAGSGGESGAAGASGAGTSGAGGNAGAAGNPPMRVCEPGEAGDCARVERVYVGGSHTCAVLSDGTIRCWGYNDSGQLGDPETAPSLSAGPVVVKDVRRPDVMALGNRHTCALKDGEVFCWGRNQLGQLGTGDYKFGLEPRFVAEGFQTVASAFNNTCGILSDTSVLCWGIVMNGQNWTGADYGLGHNEPAPVPGLADVSQLALASMSACAVDEDRTTVRCWGDGLGGKLGNGSSDDSALPVTVSPGDLEAPVHDLCANGGHVCALAGQPQRVQCWGESPYLDETSVPVTIDLPFAEEIVDVRCGWSSDCALLADGTVACWGCRHLGIAGPASSECSTSPELVVGISDATQLAFEYQHACALLSSGEVRCWGENLFGELGRGFTSDLESVPKSVVWQ